MTLAVDLYGPCTCTADYCLDQATEPNACPVCTRLTPYDPCPNEQVTGKGECICPDTGVGWYRECPVHGDDR